MSKEKYVLKIEDRTETGKNCSRRYRADGKIPAVVYRQGIDTKMILLDASEWESLSNHDLNLVTLKDQKGKETQVLIKEVQENLLKNEIVHMDFLEIRQDQVITAEIAVHTTPGSVPVGVTQGGILEQPMHTIEVSCLPKDLPEGIEVDISGIEIDESLYVSDLVLPEGVTATADPESIVFHVAHQQEEEEPEAAEGEEGVEGEEGAEAGEGEEAAGEEKSEDKEE